MKPKSKLRGWLNSIGLFVLGALLLAWGASQVSADLRDAREAGELEEQVIDAPLPTELATLQAQMSEPTPTPNPTRSARQTQEAADQAVDNTFLDTSGDFEDHSETKEIQVPDRIIIPAIGLDAAISKADVRMVEIMGEQYPQWEAPNELAAGWHTNTAGLGQKGNMVLNGHHNVYGEVFGKLVDLETGQDLIVYAGPVSRRYTITNKMILPEKYETLEVRLENARWLQPTVDERITLVTCWPYESNTHRLIIVAQPNQ